MHAYLSSLHELTQRVLPLSPEDRVQVAAEIQASFAKFESEELERACLDEVERRWQQIESGEVCCLSSEKVMEQAWTSLRCG